MTSLTACGGNLWNDDLDGKIGECWLGAADNPATGAEPADSPEWVEALDARLSVETGSDFAAPVAQHDPADSTCRDGSVFPERMSTPQGQERR